MCTMAGDLLRKGLELRSRDHRLDRLVTRVVEVFCPRAIFLFGGRAEGPKTAESDYDLLVVLPDDAAEELFDPLRAQDVGTAAGVPSDVVPVSLQTFLEFRDAPYSLIGRAHTRGVLVHGGVDGPSPGPVES
jgi:hypothetical protein